MTESTDHPAIVVPPPLIVVAALLLGLLIDWLLPVYLLETLLGPWLRGFMGGLLVATGAALGIAGRARFVEAGTNVNPWKPSTRLATAGVYRYIRNPMYAGMLLILGGLGLAFASDWTLVMTVAAAFTLHFAVVLPEERYLERTFGAQYLAFKGKVARWGIW